MERICPLLALEDDAHAVVDGYDPSHRCRALRPPEPIERSYQVSTCLQPDHATCPRYLEASAEQARPPVAALPPSADSALASTRLILEPEATHVRLVRGARRTGTRWAVGAALAAIGAVAVASGVTGALGSRESPAAMVPAGDASATATEALTPAPSIVATARPSPSETASPRPSPSPPPTPQPTRRPTPEPQPQQQTYVVQPGDTLNDIAQRFGTTAVAIQSANGLRDSDMIVIGQVLVIP